MSIWFNTKGKSYAGDGQSNWLKRYAEYLTNLLKTELNTTFSEHFAGSKHRHRAADVDVNETTTVLSALQAESSARTQADTALQASVDKAKSDALAAVTEESGARTAADTALQTSINKAKNDALAAVAEETNARTAADTALNGTLTNAVESLSASLNGLQTSAVGKKVAGGGEIFNDYENNTANGSNAIAMGAATSAGGEASVAMGAETSASGHASVAMGSMSSASGYCAFTVGDMTGATGSCSVSLGNSTTAGGDNALATGTCSNAGGDNSVAMGSDTVASGSEATAMGYGTKASGNTSVAMGYGTTAQGTNQLVLGQYNQADTTNSYATIVGNGSEGSASNAYTLDWNGNGVFAGSVTANGNKKLATEAYVTQAIGEASSASSPALSCDGARYKGYLTNSYSESDAETEGVTFADAYFGNMFDEITLPTDGVDFYRFAVDCNTTGLCSFGEITLVASDSTYYQSDGSSRCSVDMYVSIDPRSTDRVAENGDFFLPSWNLKRTWYPDSYAGESNEILESAAHWSSWAIDTAAIYATKEYVKNISVGKKASNVGGEIFNDYSGNQAGKYASARGKNTNASAYASTADGNNTIAKGNQSSALGSSTVAIGKSQHVLGEFNIEDINNGGDQRSTYVEIVGNGTSAENRSNAYTLDWQGNGVFAGNVTANGNKKLATEEYVSSLLETRIAALKAELAGA